ncbi:MAG: hypothetical protein Q9195_009078, partial [Heterodermia aff. obscurata]
TGAENTTSHLDQPDFGLAQLNDMLVQADMIAVQKYIRAMLPASTTKTKFSPNAAGTSPARRSSAPTYFRAPFVLLLNIVKNGHSQLITSKEIRQMGFRIMVFFIVGLAPALKLIKSAYEKLNTDGMTRIQITRSSSINTFEVCELKKCTHIGREAEEEELMSCV